MATIDHNFGDQNNYLVVPVSGIVKITVSTSTGAVVGTTTADRLGRWQSGFTVGNGTYDVKFEGHFRPIGLAFSGNYYAAGQRSLSKSQSPKCNWSYGAKWLNWSMGFDRSGRFDWSDRAPRY
jgi:hypothetical protein